MSCGFDPWVRKIPWRQAWQPPPVLLPGESHGQRSPPGYRPWGCKESDTTEQHKPILRASLVTQWQRIHLPTQETLGREDPPPCRRRKWQLTPVFFPGESYGRRSLAGYSPWGRRELDTSEATEHACSLQGSLKMPLFKLCVSQRERTLVALSWRPAMLRALSLAKASVHHGSELSADLSDQRWSPFQKSGTETLGGEVARPSSSAWDEACLS